MDKYAIKIQKIYRSYKYKKDFIRYLPYIISYINRNQEELTNLFIKCKKIYKQLPPQKNENKFLFGKLIEMSIIDFLNNLFKDCIDLDRLHKSGSEYKNDCRLYITNYIKFDISIKSKSKKNGSIILINNYGNNNKKDLNDLITIIIILETSELLILPNKLIDDSKYLSIKDANISYKSSLITYIYKYMPEIIIKLDENSDKYKEFMNNEYEKINEINIYKELYDKL